MNTDPPVYNHRRLHRCETFSLCYRCFCIRTCVSVCDVGSFREYMLPSWSENPWKFDRRGNTSKPKFIRDPPDEEG